MFAESPCLRGVEGAAPYKVSGKFLLAGHRKRCGVTPPPTGLGKVFRSFRLSTNKIIYFYESFCQAFFKKRESFRPAFFKRLESSAYFLHFPSIHKLKNYFYESSFGSFLSRKEQKVGQESRSSSMAVTAMLSSARALGSALVGHLVISSLAF